MTFPWPFNPYPAPDFWFGWPALPDDDEDLHVMTTEPETLPDKVVDAKPLFQQVTRQRHTWGPQRRRAPDQTQSQREQLEWKCMVCPLVRITIFGAKEPRAYRIEEGGREGPQFYADAEPACVGNAEAKA